MAILTRIVCAACFFIGASALALPPASRPATGSVKASLDALIQQGLEAMAAKQMDAAREAFHDAVALDKSNRTALHGLAVCQMAARDMTRAKESFDKLLALTPQPDRAVVLNAAAFFQASRSAPRAIKIVKDYLTAHPNTLDEPMVNALGSALASASPTDRKARLFSDAAAFYMIVNQRLERARPGYKRFGDAWLPDAEYNAKFAQWQAKEQEISVASEAVAEADDKLAAAEDYVALCRSKLRWSRSAKIELPKAEAAAAQAERELAIRVQAMEKIAATAQRPSFPKRIAVVAMDAVNAPELSIATANSPETPATRTTVAAATPKNDRRPDPVKPEIAVAIPANPAPPTPTPETPVKPGTVDSQPAVAMNTPVSPAVTPPRRARVTHYAAGFAISADTIVTAAAAVPEGATVQVQFTDGRVVDAKLLRADREAGIALVKLPNGRLPTLAIAETFAPGPISCPAYPTVDLFNPVPRVLRGLAPLPVKDAPWTVSLGQHPRLPGSPLVSNGKVVGLCIAARDSEVAKLPAATLEQLRAFAGADAVPGTAAQDPVQSMVQIVSTRDRSE